MIDKIDYYLKQLSEFGVFLMQIKQYLSEIEVPNHNNKAVKNILDGFFIPTGPTPGVFEDLQLNSVKAVKGVFDIFTKKEIDKMPKLKDLSYRYRPDGIHEFRYRRNGMYKAFCSVKLEVAKRKALDFCAELNAIIGRQSDSLRNKTVDFVAEAWFSIKKMHWNPETFKGYYNAYKRHIAPTFGKRLIKHLLPIDLQPYFTNLYEYSGKICENVKILLNGIFDYAVANRICPSNPMKGVIVEKHFRTPGSALSNEQIVRFIEHMKRDTSPFGLAGLIILYSGIRGAELQSLTFDWDKGTFTVKNAKLKKGQKVNPNNLYRTVPIFPGLYKLKERIETEPWRLHPNNISGHFTDHWPENPAKDLRHTFISKAREAGIENELVNLWTGHLPGKNVTANVYTHFSLDYQLKEAKKLTNY